jgi:hypothetical protein
MGADAASGNGGQEAYRNVYQKRIASGLEGYLRVGSRRMWKPYLPNWKQHWGMILRGLNCWFAL